MPCHQACYRFAPEHAFYSWDYWKVPKNLYWDSFPLNIFSISVRATMGTFLQMLVFMAKENTIIATSMNIIVIHAYGFQ